MKYKKKPVTIEAVQFLGYFQINTPIGEKTIETKVPTFSEQPNWLKMKLGEAIYTTSNDTLVIKTLEGEHVASKDDYIIQGVQGEIYPCKPDIFEATYTKVKEKQSNSYVKIETEYYIDGYHLVGIAMTRGHRCGYVGISEDHPAYGLEMDELNKIDVHGDVTYAEAGLSPEIVEQFDFLPKKELWYIGFDYSHTGDALDKTLIPIGSRMLQSSFLFEGRKWNTVAVRDEIFNLYHQLRGWSN